MGEREGWPQPSGLLPEKSSSFAALCRSSLEDEQWRWEEAEGRTSELISRIQPTKSSEERRKAVADYVRCLILKCFDCQVFTFGSVPLKTYLPDGDIDLTAFSRLHHLKDTWATNVRSILEAEEHKENAQFHVKEVQYIQAEVKIIKCLVENIVVDISFNQLGGICTLCFLEEVDRLIGQNHLFKRSIILVKAWCYYESRILGAHHGLISTYALETLVLYIFHVFHASLRGPLEVLFWFLEFFSNFDWDKYCVSLWGPVPLSSLSGISGMHALRSTAEPPRKDGDKLLLGDRFLEACGNQYAVCPTPNDNQARAFPSKYMNVIDPLRTSNNLGRSVSKGNFFRIRSAFAFGARKLAHILQCSKDNLTVELDVFFLNTWDRHGNGGRPDAPDYVDRQLQPDFLEDSKDGNHEHSNEEIFTADVDATFFKSKIFNDAEEVHQLQQSDKEGSPVFSDGSDSHSRRGAKGITTHNVVENGSIFEVRSSAERSGDVWQEQSRHSIGGNYIAATNKSDAPKDKHFPDFAGQFSSAAIPGGKGTRQIRTLGLPVERQNGKMANARDSSQELPTISFDTFPNFTMTDIKFENKPVIETLSSRSEHTEILAGEEPLFTDNSGNVDFRDSSSRILSTTSAVPHLCPIPFVPMPVSLPVSNSLRMVSSIPPPLSQPLSLAGPPPPPLPFRAGQPLSAFNDPVPGSGPAPPVGSYLAMQLPRGPPLSPFVGLPTLSLSANPISAPRTPLEQKHIQAPWKSSSEQVEDLEDPSSSGVTQQPDVGMHHEISVASFHPPAVIRPYQSSHNVSMAIEQSMPIPWNGASAEDNETEDGGNWEDDLESEQLQTEGFPNGELSGGYADQSYGKDRVKDTFSEALTGMGDVSVSFPQSWGIQNAVEPSILGIDGYPLMHSPASNIAPSDANSTSGSSVGGESSAFAPYSSPHILLGQRTGVQSQSTFIRPDRWQRTTDKQGLSSFYYSTNAPLAYVPMYPLYFIHPPDGAVGIGGLPATHTLDALGDGTAIQFTEDGQFVAPFSRGVGERLIAAGIPVTAGPRGSMPFDKLSEGAGIHDSRFDLLTSDFAGHLRNLDYARLCQSPFCQSPPPFIPFYIQPQKEYQGHHLPEGPGRPVQTNPSFSKHTIAPHGPGRVGGGYHRNFEDLPKQHGGTGTYLPGMRHNAYRGGGRSQQDSFQDRNDYSERDYVPPPRYRAMGRGQKFDFRGEKAGQSSKVGEKGWDAQRSETLRRNSVQAFPVAFTSPNSAGTPLYVLPPYSTAGNEPLEFGSLGSLQFGAIQVSDDTNHHGHGRQPEDSTFPVPGERQPPSPRHQSRSTQRAYQLKEEDFPPLSFRGQRGNNSATSSNRGTHYQAYVESRT